MANGDHGKKAAKKAVKKSDVTVFRESKAGSWTVRSSSKKTAKKAAKKR
jgi:hypothetical protein